MGGLSADVRFGSHAANQAAADHVSGPFSLCCGVTPS